MTPMAIRALDAAEDAVRFAYGVRHVVAGCGYAGVYEAMAELRLTRRVVASVQTEIRSRLGNKAGTN